MLRRVWFGLVILIEIVAASASAQPQLPASADDVVVLAKDAIIIGLNAQQESGQVVVDDLGGVAVVAKSYSTLPDLSPQFVADVVRVRSGARTGPQFFDLFANTLYDPGQSISIQGTGPIPIDPQSFPLLPFPSPVSVTPGDTTVIVKPVDLMTLPPGNYRDILVRHRAQLFFEGGTYNVRSLRAAFNARIRFNGPTTLNIADRLRVGARSTVEPSASGGDSALNSRCIVINVAGSHPVRFGAQSHVTATINAPNAFLRLGKSGVYRGNFTASAVHLGRLVVLQAESPLTSPCL